MSPFRKKSGHPEKEYPGYPAARFPDGIRQWSRLQYASIVKVLQFGDELFPWLAMEYMAKTH